MLAVNEDVAKMALWYRFCGLSVIPVVADCSKQSFIHRWTDFIDSAATFEEMHHWFQTSTPLGVAILTGRASAGLEVLDIGNKSKQFNLLSRLPSELSEKLVFIDTPSGGLHIYYRITSDSIKPLQLLAEDIELYGSGRYVIAPGSPPECHTSLKRWRQRSDRGLDAIQVITPDERILLLEAATNLTCRQRIIKESAKIQEYL